MIKHSPALYINTTRNPIPVENIGKVLIHEHIFCRVRPEGLKYAASYLTSQFDTLLKHGVETIVDLTTYVLPDQYLPIINPYPINVICCAGFYLQNKVPKPYHDLGVDALAEKVEYKITHGIGRSKIKPGILKVASSGREFSRFEKNAIQAIGQVQSRYRIPVATHATRGGRKQLELLMKSGADPHQVLISHVEMELKGKGALSLPSLLQDVLWILEQGASIFVNDFSVQEGLYRKNIIQLLHFCCSKGYTKQVFIGTDSYWSWRRGVINVRGSSMNSHTPRTYEYTFSLITPLLLKNGFTQCDIDHFLKYNAVRLFRGAQ